MFAVACHYTCSLNQANKETKEKIAKQAMDPKRAKDVKQSNSRFL